ncbi:MAG TPA: TRAP transporter small permease subunit [Casimicrobiaceae bacterium]|nr:TRAP transporter small permease subunit [Casimicrobiaceae bacterium]
MIRSESAGDALTRTLDAITRVVGRVVAWLILPMVASLVYEVTARYVFDAPTIWAYDMTYMLYGTFFMLGSAWTLQRGGHIRTDTFYADWTPRTRAIVDMLCYLILFLPPMIVFLKLGIDYFWKSFQQNERIVTSPWLPIVWPFKFVMPATAALLILQGVSELIKSVRVAIRPASAQS